MWQVIIGAAIAGSTGLVAAKRFFNPFSPPEYHCQEEHDPVTPPPPVGIGFLNSPCDKTNGVFRFSSSGSAGSGSGSSPGFRKCSGVSCKVKVRGLMKQKKKKKKNNGGGSEIENRSGSVPLKKARTLSAASGSKRGSRYDNNQDRSTFSSALGVCMMYMMSAEKKEISKLHTATEETVKVIQELKDELSRIQSLQGFHEVKSSGISNPTKSEMATLDTKSGNDGEYASSVLTEEPEHDEAVEMEQLEMELESELQKLNLAEISECMEECKDVVNGSESSYQCGGISASELDKKLSRLLIEQQEGQINELEAELQTTQSKLQALKVCVRRLTEFPLLDRSDDEQEQDMKEETSVSWCQHNQTDTEERKVMVGMKRPMESSIHV